MSKYQIADTDHFTEMFKALSNPHRLSIVMRLACPSAQMKAATTDAQICECIGILGKDLGIAPSTVSHHIKELCRAGLIKMKRRGQNIECQVDLETLNSLAAFFKQLSNIKQEGNDK